MTHLKQRVERAKKRAVELVAQSAALFQRTQHLRHRRRNLLQAATLLRKLRQLQSSETSPR